MGRRVHRRSIFDQMLKTGFIGNENSFDRFICEWLSEHTDLRLILWTNKVSWAENVTDGRGRRVFRRFVSRVRRMGTVRVLDEALYYYFYRRFISPGEVRKCKRLLSGMRKQPPRSLSNIDQVHIDD